MYQKVHFFCSDSVLTGKKKGFEVLTAVMMQYHWPEIRGREYVGTNFPEEVLPLL